MAGLSAAAWSVRQGQSVVLVEKGELGGSAARAGFIWTAPTVESLRAAIPDGDPELQRTLVEGFRPAVDWVRSTGVEVLPPVAVLRFGRGHQVSLPNYLHTCEIMIRGDARSELVVGGEAQRLIVEDGAVRGAVVRLPSGETREIRAEHTLLATGGFGGDPELRAELIHPNARDLPLRANRFSRGDGLRLAREAGAAFGPEDAGFYGHLMAAGVQLREEDDYAALSLFQSEHAALFNVHAERFVDETIGDHLTTLALLKQPGARGVLISDQRARDELLGQPYVEGIQPIDFFDNVYRRGAQAAIAEDLDELAYLPKEWGFDGEAIRQALLDFNRACAEGTLDPPRTRDPRPIDQPPFYVVVAVPAITFSFGGLRIDTAARVLSEQGEPIPGLLAAGADASGAYVRAYAGGLAWALVFGLRAAETALEAGRRHAPAAAGTEAAFLSRYFELLDEGEDVLPMLAPDFTFALLWATPEGAREFAGGFDAWAGYMAQREPDGQRHHVSHSLSEGRSELVTGCTTRFGEPLGTFMFAAELDDEGRARRFFAARTQAFGGTPF